MLQLLVLVTLCTYATCVSDEMQELALMLHNTCVGETGVSEELIENCRKGNFADDTALKCYMKCLMEQMACIDDDGTVDGDALIAVLPEELQAKGAPIIKNCGTKVGKDVCENVWLTNKCYYDADPSAYFLV